MTPRHFASVNLRCKNRTEDRINECRCCPHDLDRGLCGGLLRPQSDDPSRRGCHVPVPSRPRPSPSSSPLALASSTSSSPYPSSSSSPLALASSTSPSPCPSSSSPPLALASSTWSSGVTVANQLRGSRRSTGSRSFSGTGLSCPNRERVTFDPVYATEASELTASGHRSNRPRWSRCKSG